MKPLLASILLLSRSSLRRAFASDEVYSCACAARDEGFTIDCSSTQPMYDALVVLQNNGCRDSCASEICRTNYHIIQSHQDYCLADEIPDPVTTGLHTYESACDDCRIVRKSNPALPSCPVANCNDNSGNEAYYFLIANCYTDCNTNVACGDNFRVLRAVYDTCPEDTLDFAVEIGLNNLVNSCQQQDCNVGNSATDAQQLVCGPTTPATTPSTPPPTPPVTPPPTPSLPTSPPTFQLPPPSPTPEVLCPIVPAGGCSICGGGRCVTFPDAVFAWPGQPQVLCGELEQAANSGNVPLQDCPALPNLVHNICGCKDATRYYSPTPSPTIRIPTVAPPTIVAPTRAPAPMATPPTTTSQTESSSNGGLNGGAIFGIVAACLLGLIAVGIVVCCTHRRQARNNVQKEVPPPVETAAETALESKDIGTKDVETTIDAKDVPEIA